MNPPWSVDGRAEAVRLAAPGFMLQRTPLFDAHQRLGGKLIEFGGWEMPVHYTSITEEHLAVRRAGGLFDICHMGEISVCGPAALEFLNHTLTNDARKLAVGQGQYTLLCHERGGVIDDLYAYRIGEEDFLMIVNASRIEADMAWLEKQHAAAPRRAQVRLRNVSDQTGAVALQGPRVRQFVDQGFPGPFTGGAKVSHASELKKNEIALTQFEGMAVYLGCTGYTGKMASRSSRRGKSSSPSGPNSWRSAGPVASSPPGSVPATRCGRKFVTRSTATNWTNRRLPSKPGSVCLSRSTRVNSSGAVCWPGRRPKARRKSVSPSR